MVEAAPAEVAPVVGAAESKGGPLTFLASAIYDTGAVAECVAPSVEAATGDVAPVVGAAESKGGLFTSAAAAADDPAVEAGGVAPVDDATH